MTGNFQIEMVHSFINFIIYSVVYSINSQIFVITKHEMLVKTTNEQLIFNEFTEQFFKTKRKLIDYIFNYIQ